MIRRAYALLYLSYCGFIFILKKLCFFRRRDSYQAFIDNYASDGLPEFSPDFRKIAATVGDCTTCGLCDAVCPQLQISHSEFPGPMRLVATSFRGGTSLDASRESIELMVSSSCAACRKCEEACPQRIPIIELARGFAQQL